MVLGLFLSLILVGLLIEKLLHMDYHLEPVVMPLKTDIKRVFSSMFMTEVPRHVFDVTLVDDLQGIVKPYSQPMFDIKLENVLFRNVPMIRVQFVPEHTLADTELEEISKLLHLKLEEYLRFYSLNWKTFVSYSVGSDYVNIMIFYSEFDTDLVSFTNLYRLSVRQSNKHNNGVLRDKDLEKELRTVNVN